MANADDDAHDEAGVGEPVVIQIVDVGPFGAEDMAGVLKCSLLASGMDPLVRGQMVAALIEDFGLEDAERLPAWIRPRLFDGNLRASSVPFGYLSSAEFEVLLFGFGEVVHPVHVSATLFCLDRRPFAALLEGTAADMDRFQPAYEEGLTPAMKSFLDRLWDVAVVQKRKIQWAV